jgi:DNA-binding NarL/FixJ family response regulator
VPSKLASDHVLVVDDDAHFRASVVTLLATAGVETREAASGREAIAAARADCPSLLLLDVSLPDMNGYQVLHTLRDECGDDLPIVFVSGEKIDSIDVTAGLLIGGNDYVLKPVDPSELLARVHRFRAAGRTNRGGLRSRPPAYNLTQREAEVLELLAEGFAPVDVARKLLISKRTVATHIQHILAKLGVRSVAQAIALAYREHLVQELAAEERRVGTASGGRIPSR